MIVQLDHKLVSEQWPALADGSIYLNNGSCGRKPLVVLDGINQGLAECNLNPTLFTFMNTAPREKAITAASKLFNVPAESLFLINSTTNGLQLFMQSFCVNEGDELITSDREHGSTRSICRFLEESRGVVVKKAHLDPFAGSRTFAEEILKLVTKKTKIVSISEIDCYSGWRPDLTYVNDELAKLNIPFLVDGAHAPGSGPCTPGKYPLWVGSGHKWLSGPNATAFAYVSPQYAERLQPVWVSDRLYESKDLARFEWQGTGDIARLTGLAAAIDLQLKLDPVNIARRQQELMSYARHGLEKLPGGEIRTPDNQAEAAGLITITWDKCPVENLQETLWQKQRIWVQPDLYFGNVGYGIRLSMHVSTSEAELDKLFGALTKILN